MPDKQTFDIRQRPDIGSMTLAKAVAAMAKKRTGIEWQARALPEVDGSIVFYFKSSGGKVVISWTEAKGGVEFPDISGTFVFNEVKCEPKGLENSLLNILGHTLSSTLKREAFKPIKMVEKYSSPQNPDEFTEALENWFKINESGWFDYRLTNLETKGDTTKLEFSNNDKEVTFDFIYNEDFQHNSTVLLSMDDESLLMTRSVVFLIIDSDKRNAKERNSIEHQVERAVGFAFTRIINPTDERGASGENEEHEAPKLGGGQQLDNYYFLDRNTSWRQFMAADDIVTHHTFRWMNTPNMHIVQHADRSCMNIWPVIPHSEFSLYSMQDSDNQNKSKKLFLTTDIRGYDALMTGGEDSLRELLEYLAQESNSENLYTIRKTCLPKLLGQNVDQLLEDIKDESDLEIFTFYPEDYFISPESSLKLLLGKIFDTKIKHEKSPKPSVALLGLPGRADTDELALGLSRMGIDIAAKLIPALNHDDIDNYRKAWIQVFPVSQSFDRNLRVFFEKLEDFPHIEPNSPYGLHNTLHWYKQIAKALEMEDTCLPVFNEYELDISQYLSEARSRSEKINLAFIVESNQLPRIWDAEQNDGLSMLTMLQEFGFSCQAFVYNADQMSDFEEMIKKIVKKTEVNGADLSKLKLEFFKNEQELEKLLQDPKVKAIYTDYTMDQRPLKYGKATFSLRDFELGFDGAKRSFEKIITRCQTPYYQRAKTKGTRS